MPGALERRLQSSEQLLAADAANSEQTAQQLPVKPEWSRQRHEEWLDRADRLPPEARSDGGGPNPASPNPPLYYLWLIGPYQVASGEDLFTRVSAMRLASIPFLLLTVTAAWLLAGTVFGRKRPQQLAAASVPALLPMMTFISSSVTPDALLYALSGVVLWLGARILLRRDGLRDVVAISVVAGLAVLTKATAYALLPGVALAVVGGALRARGGPRRLILTGVVAVTAFALVVMPWYLVARANDRAATGQLVGAAPASNLDVREFGSYVWQYYLPRLPFQTRYAPLGDYPQSYETWFKQGIGAFGWLETRWPPGVYAVLLIAALVILTAAAVTVVRRRRQLDLLLVAFFAITVVALIAGLHWSEYRLAESSGALFSQGRYLFPLLPLGGLVVAAAISSVPLRWRPNALGVFVAGLVVLQLFSIGLVVTRFYA